MNKKEFDTQKITTLKNDFEDVSIFLRIKRLLLSESFAVLCTQGDLSAYGSLVAFQVSDDLSNIIFATLNYTRKYQLLKKCDQVAMVIDDRSQHKNNISQISAVTINGAARKVQDSSKIEVAKNSLLEKHGYLNELVSSDSCAFFKVEINRYLYVTHLQEVYEWKPG